MTLNEIIERKKEELKKEYNKQTINYVAFLEKAIRESVEEALREVRPLCANPRIKEKKRYREYNIEKESRDWIDGYKNCERHILNMPFIKRLIFVLFGKYILFDK